MVTNAQCLLHIHCGTSDFIFFRYSFNKTFWGHMVRDYKDIPSTVYFNQLQYQYSFRCELRLFCRANFFWDLSPELFFFLDTKITQWEDPRLQRIGGPVSTRCLLVQVKPPPLSHYHADHNTKSLLVGQRREGGGVPHKLIIKLFS